MSERNLDFDTPVERKGTDCLKYDFAVERECQRIYCLCGWQIWTSG